MAIAEEPDWEDAMDKTWSDCSEISGMTSSGTLSGSGNLGMSVKIIENEHSNETHGEECCIPVMI